MKKRNIKKLDMELSPLGFGVMRLPQNADGGFQPEIHSLLEAALEKGINYFDTAYIYLGGHSEELVRDALVRKHPRNSFYIADKLPVWDCKNRKDMDRIFNTQLERLGVQHIDFYLLHGLHHQSWLDIYNKNVLDFLNEKRREGRIRKVGFSMHDTLETLKIIEGAYDWDFIQLQINYYDWIAQRAKESYDYLAERNIPCMVMEPVGGGRLSNLPPQAVELLNNVHPNESAAAWALRFVAALPNVAVTLSGMNTVEQLNENIETFGNISPLSNIELDAINDVVKLIQSKNTIPCTACRYCVDDCHKGVDIPNIFQRYNDCNLFNNCNKLDAQYFLFVPDGKRADSCTTCGKCKRKCPQGIDIPQNLKKIHKEAVRLYIQSYIATDIESLSGKENITLFGCGIDGCRILASLREFGINVRWFCDNNSQLWGSMVEGVEVVSPQKLRELDAIVLIASSKYRDEIRAQLAEMGVEFF
jgi:predicted aldo/keto reductase-like oxidoreductase